MAAYIGGTANASAGPADMGLVSVVLSMIEDNTTLMSSGPANQIGVIAQPHFLGRCSPTVAPGGR